MRDAPASARVKTGWSNGGVFLSLPNGRLLAELWKAALGFFLLALTLYVVTLKRGDFFFYDLQHFIVGYDFLNLWMAGKLSLTDHPAQFYEWQHYAEALTAVVGPHHPELVLSYPPVQFLLGLPFGLLPYGLAYLLWLALNLAALCYALKGLLGKPLLLLLLICPVALIWLICGQSSLLTAALTLSALRLLTKAPWKAGICIGLLVIKPQLGILFPLLLIATGQWRAFISATVTVLVVAGITYAWLGAEPWMSYVAYGIPEHVSMFFHPTDLVTSLTPTLFNDLLVLGVDGHTALVVQTLLGLLAAIALVLGLRRANDPGYRWLLFATCSSLATCYMLSYDLMIFMAMLLYFLKNHPLHPREGWLFAACFWWPLLDFFLNAHGIAGPSLLPVALLLWLLFIPRDRLHSAVDAGNDVP